MRAVSAPTVKTSRPGPTSRTHRGGATRCPAARAQRASRTASIDSPTTRARSPARSVSVRIGTRILREPTPVGSDDAAPPVRAPGEDAAGIPARPHRAFRAARGRRLRRPRHGEADEDQTDLLRCVHDGEETRLRGCVRRGEPWRCTVRVCARARSTGELPPLRIGPRRSRIGGFSPEGRPPASRVVDRYLRPFGRPASTSLTGRIDGEHTRGVPVGRRDPSRRDAGVLDVGHLP